MQSPRGVFRPFEPWLCLGLLKPGNCEVGVPPHTVEAALNHVSGAKEGVARTYNVEAYMEGRKEALEKWAYHVHRIVSEKVSEVMPQASDQKETHAPLSATS